MCNVLSNLWCESNHFMSVACYLVSMLITMACWRGELCGPVAQAYPAHPGALERFCAEQLFRRYHVFLQGAQT